MKKFRIKNIALGIVLLCAISFAVSGCTSAENNSTDSNAPSSAPTFGPEPTIGQIEKITDPSQITRPVQQFFASPEEIMAAYNKLGEQENGCLKSKGYKGDYNPLPGNFTNSNATNLNPIQEWGNEFLDDNYNNDLWGHFNIEKIQKYGYESGPPIMVGSFPKYDFDNDKAVKKECIQDVDNASPAIDGSFESYLTIDAQMWPDGGPTVPLTDSRIVAAQANWVNCMKEKGYNYNSLKDVDAKYHGNMQKASSEEIAAANADIQCKIQTNLVGIGVAVQTAYDNQYIDAHRNELQAMKQKLLDYIAGK
jgi:hypothetical protein